MGVNRLQHVPVMSPPPGVGVGSGGFDKSGVLIEYANRFHVKTLVETGLYQGHGSGMSLASRLDYVAIDYQQENIEFGKQVCPTGRFLCGDSAVELARLLEGELRLPVLFWLDAHAISDGEGAPTVCPLAAELPAIAAWRHADQSVVLVDDLWAMGSIRGWPTLDELRELAALGPWDVDETGGIMRLTPRVYT